MKILEKRENTEAEMWMQKAAELAREALCEDAKCGTVIVKDGECIGEGYNSPAGGREDQRKCEIPKTAYHFKVTDKTCCVHAEQRAIMDALRRNPQKLFGSRLYFVRVDKEREPIRAAGKPYCTICSKMTLDVGIKEFVLWQKEGICVYDTGEYNLLSYQYTES
jgi:deoxycytidylate deaminase